MKKYWKQFTAVGLVLFLCIFYMVRESNIREKGLRAMALVLEIKQTNQEDVLVGLIIYRRPAYKTLRDMIMKFKPRNKQEAKIKLNVLTIMLSCLIEAKRIVEEQGLPPITGI